MSDTRPDDLVTLETDIPFGKSCIWDLQTEFFVERGPEAFKRDGVPSYLTSNPVMAFTYARLLIAWLRRLPAGKTPPVILELGAGSGALAFRVVRELLLQKAPPFRYLMTDIAEQNLAAWSTHPRLRPLVEQGVLDFALFDATNPQPFPDLNDMPGLAVLGNYVLDSIPQDLFFVKDGALHEALCTVLSHGEPGTAPPADRLNRLELRYSTRQVEGAPCGDPWLDALVEWYRTHLEETYVLLPAVAIRALHFLRSMSGGNLLCLFADKGRWLPEAMEGSGPPVPAHHGSFSIEVNFHAHALHCSAAGGSPLLPSEPRPGITIACLDYAAVGLDTEYRSLVDAGGPEEIFRAVNGAVPRFGSMQFEELLDWVTLSRHDPLPFQLMLPWLRELAPGLDAGQAEGLSQAMAAVWEQYFPAGLAGEADLGYELGVLSVLTGDLAGAIGYFSGSIALLGPSTGAQLNLAACFESLGEPAKAMEILQQVVEREPMNVDARTLLIRCMSATAAG